MRKHMILLTSVFLAGLIGAAVVTGVLLRRERTVVMSETVKLGTAAAADGLEIVFTEYPMLDDEKESSRDFIRLNDRQWRNTLTFENGKGSLATELIKEDKDFLDLERKWRAHADFVDMATYYFEIVAQYHEYSRSEVEELLPPDMRVSIRESLTPVTIRLSEYMEYYPMLWYMNFPRADNDSTNEIIVSDDGRRFPTGDHIVSLKEYKEWESGSGIYEGESRTDYSKEKEIARKFEEYFRIPVISGDLREIFYPNHMPGDYPEITVAGDYYEPVYVCGTTSEAMYFTFNTHTNEGNLVDTSLIPGGYGIYRLPYTIDNEKGTTTILIDELTVFVPLTPEADQVQIMISDDWKNMMIYYTLDGMDNVRIIELASGQCVFESELGQAAEGGWYVSTDATDDLLILTMRPKLFYDDYGTYEEQVRKLGDKSKLFVFQRDASGNYDIALSAKAALEETMRDAEYAFDGKRLAQVVKLYNDFLQIYVYTENGMEYKGEYKFSISEAATVKVDGTYIGGGTVESWGLECRFK